jgi:prepilin-type N-terminal cleavage/methylation domain-containing protein
MQRGFTLIELMVVVGVVGIAGAVAAFNMADQVRDARAAADVQTVVEELRKEHRLAREQMLGLKITSTGHDITFQSTQGAHCKDGVGAPRIRAHDHAVLSVLFPTGALCLDDRGEMDVVLGQTGTTTPTEPVLTIKANLSGNDRVVFTALRFEKSGLSVIRTLKVSADGAKNIESALVSDFPGTAAILAGPLKGVVTTAPPGPAGLPQAPPQCPDPNTGQLTTCVNFNFQ